MPNLPVMLRNDYLMLINSTRAPCLSLIRRATLETENETETSLLNLFFAHSCAATLQCYLDPNFCVKLSCEMVPEAFQVKINHIFSFFFIHLPVTLP